MLIPAAVAADGLSDNEIRTGKPKRRKRFRVVKFIESGSFWRRRVLITHAL
jgi:hypothetical protein